MTLNPGTRLGPYEIVAPLGVGGMGEVYRAADTNLKRQVAIKVLPASVAADADRLARFQREAEILAALNHPNIAHIHGLEKAQGTVALVMELVEGPTLADRIAQGPMSLDDALPIARQIAEALEAAHEQGIIHRDLKPANIKVRADGTAKVLDFGLARVAEPAGAASASVTASPTITSPALMTAVGMLLGTAAYMSPEQAKGRPADKRSDVWAFGCVLYEMLTGKRAFDGDDVSDTLAAVLRGEPDLTRLPPETPPAVSRLQRRCLHKDPRYRLQHMGDVRLELDERDVERPAAPRTARPLVWLVLAAALAGIAGIGAVLLARSSRPTAAVTRFTIPLPPAAAISTAPGFDLVLSPDGRTLVFGNAPSGLFKRSLDSIVVEPLRGAESGGYPFFSPDGSWIGFRSGGQLRKISVSGGTAVTICADCVPNADTSTWSEDNVIVFRRGSDLYKVPANGGTPELVLKADVGTDFTQPRFVPHSHLLLVQVQGAALGVARIEAIELDSGRRHRLIEGNTPQWSPPGDLLFERDNTIWAVPLNLQQVRLEGTPAPVVPAVRRLIIRAVYSAAGGALAYVPGDRQTNRSIVWLDRSGRATPALLVRDAFQSPRLSPDGTRVAISVANRSALDVWVYDLARGTRLRLTTTGVNRRSVWSPDGTQIAFYAAPDGGDQDLFVVPAAGGEPKRLLARPDRQFPDSWSPDGRFLAFEESSNAGGRGRDLWLLPIGEPARPLVVTRFNERSATIAPSGRFFAFVSDESGTSEVYVQPFPGPGAKMPVSTNGGVQPMWSRDGRELYYREGEWLMFVAAQLDPFHLSAPQRLFELPSKAYNLDQNFADYDLAPDGRFLAIRNEDSEQDQLHVVVNWTEELKQRVPTK